MALPQDRELLERWMDQNWSALAAVAWDGFLKHGRGIVIPDSDGPVPPDAAPPARDDDAD